MNQLTEACSLSVLRLAKFRPDNSLSLVSYLIPFKIDLDLRRPLFLVAIESKKKYRKTELMYKIIFFRS